MIPNYIAGPAGPNLALQVLDSEAILLKQLCLGDARDRIGQAGERRVSEGKMFFPLIPVGTSKCAWLNATSGLWRTGVGAFRLDLL